MVHRGNPIIWRKKNLAYRENPHFATYGVVERKDEAPACDLHMYSVRKWYAIDDRLILNKNASIFTSWIIIDVLSSGKWLGLLLFSGFYRHFQALFSCDSFYSNPPWATTVNSWAAAVKWMICGKQGKQHKNSTLVMARLTTEIFITAKHVIHKLSPCNEEGPKLQKYILRNKHSKFLKCQTDVR